MGVCMGVRMDMGMVMGMVRHVLELKRTLESRTDNHEQFFNQLETSTDGFETVAEYCGKGVLGRCADVSSLDAVLQLDEELRRAPLHMHTVGRVGGGGAGSSGGSSRGRQGSHAHAVAGDKGGLDYGGDAARPTRVPV